MANVFDITKAVIDYGAAISRVDLPIQAMHHTDRIPGQRFVGAFQPGVSRVGSEFMAYSGVISELRGQAASGTVTPESLLFEAMGFLESGATGFTYTLGDPHATDDTPAGALTRIASLKLTIDTLQWVSEFSVADGTFNWRAGEIPTLTSSIMGNVPTGWTEPDVVANPAVVVGPLPAPWQAAAMTIGGVANLRVLEVSISLQNQMLMRRDAQAEFGYSKPVVPSRNVIGSLFVEAPAVATWSPEALAQAGTVQALSWVYTAGGASFNTITNTITVSLQDPEPTDLDNVLGYRLPFQARPLTGPLTMVNT